MPSVCIKSRKRKFAHPNHDSIENKYEDQIKVPESNKKRKFLPIKTRKGGLVLQEIENEEEHSQDTENTPVEENEQLDDQDKDDNSQISEPEKPVSTLQLLAARNKLYQEKKIQIGRLSAALLENPEEKVSNLRQLLQILNDKNSEVYLSIRKIVVVSLVEVFKDILPSYEIKKVTQENVKLKKDTLKLQKYEENLLNYYKKFLCSLDKYCMPLIKKKIKVKDGSEDNILSELAVKALCDLIVAHPNFNYSQNIAQVLAPLLNSSSKTVRSMVKLSIITVFKEDKKKEITLTIMRLLNNYLKSHPDIKRTEILETFLELELENVNLDQEKIQNIKLKKMKQKKSKVLNMSKKESKRKKKMKELEKDMLELNAEEAQKFKQNHLTEISKLLFNIYFRILKHSTNTKSLSVCLEGLSKFAHCINLEYYIDIVNVLGKLLDEEWLNTCDQLHCIQTIFKLLSGQGQSIDIDPGRFYNILYKNILEITADNNHQTVLMIVKVLTDALVKRRKSVTNKRMIGFVKRIATCSLHLLHNGSLAYLGLIKDLLQQNHSIDILLDLDRLDDGGRFQPDIDDPEYSNAMNTSLFDMVLLSRHYHPVVRTFAKSIASGLPISGNHRLPLEYGKLTPENLYKDFSMDNIEFNPAIPYFDNSKSNNKLKLHNFNINLKLYEDVKDILSKNPENADFVNNLNDTLL